MGNDPLETTTLMIEVAWLTTLSTLEIADQDALVPFVFRNLFALPVCEGKPTIEAAEAAALVALVAALVALVLAALAWVVAVVALVLADVAELDALVAEVAALVADVLAAVA